MRINAGCGIIRARFQGKDNYRLYIEDRSSGMRFFCIDLDANDFAALIQGRHVNAPANMHGLGYIGKVAESMTLKLPMPPVVFDRVKDDAAAFADWWDENVKPHETDGWHAKEQSTFSWKYMELGLGRYRVSLVRWQDDILRPSEDSEVTKVDYDLKRNGTIIVEEPEKSGVPAPRAFPVAKTSYFTNEEVVAAEFYSDEDEEDEVVATAAEATAAENEAYGKGSDGE